MFFTVSSFGGRAANLAESEAGSGDHAESDDERGDGEAVENHVPQRVKSAENRNAEKGGNQKRRQVDWLKIKSEINSPLYFCWS